MEFDMNKFKKFIKDMQSPSLIAFCTPLLVECLKELWDNKIAKVEFRPLPYHDDKIYVFPVEVVNKPFTVEMPEMSEESQVYYDLLFGKYCDKNAVISF